MNKVLLNKINSFCKEKTLIYVLETNGKDATLSFYDDCCQHKTKDESFIQIEWYFDESGNRKCTALIDSRNSMLPSLTTDHLLFLNELMVVPTNEELGIYPEE